jgi:hypothetical protein
MSTEQHADRPTLVSQSELNTIAKLLPEGALVLTGVKLSYPTAAQGGASDSPANCVLGPCVLVISAQDDHTIHKSEMCGSGTSFEVCSDTVISHW